MYIGHLKIDVCLCFASIYFQPYTATLSNRKMCVLFTSSLLCILSNSIIPTVWVWGCILQHWWDVWLEWMYGYLHLCRGWRQLCWCKLCFHRMYWSQGKAWKTQSVKVLFFLNDKPKLSLLFLKPYHQNFMNLHDLFD